MRPYVLLTLLTALTAALTEEVEALEVGLTLTQESEYTTNTALTETDEVEEWIHSPGVTLVANHEGPAISLDVDYEINRNFYQQDVFDNDNEAAGSANLVWNALPERLDFTIDHTRTQSAIRSAGALTPDNRQESVVTNAGPTLRFNPRGQDEILIEYLYGQRSTSETETDATTHDASLRYILALSSTSSLTLAAIKNQVQWDNPADPDIDYNIAQLTWDRETPNINYSVTGGYNRAERTLDRDDVTSFIYDVGVEWQVRPGTLITFLAARDVRDQTYNLTSGEFASELDFAASSTSAEVFISKRYGIGISQRLGGRTTLDFSAIRNDEDYEEGVADDDNKGYHLEADLTRQLSQQLDLSLSLAYDPLEYPDIDQKNDQLSGLLSLDYAIGPRFNIGIGIGYEERESEVPSGTTKYDEWSAILRISYDAIQINR